MLKSYFQRDLFENPYSDIELFIPIISIILICLAICGVSGYGVYLTG